ncbi:MAG: DNA polymerase III, partial [Elusimicrobia bacterium]|nr:DNA polymerase III [Elusimicrobiota bacterium]MBD3412252.1 DNA polymerase III [Elusimicrobiota bacterium]
MPVQNNDIVRIFNKTADLLELNNENPFRVRAYRTAARTVGGLSQPIIEKINHDEDLSRLSGIGKDLAGKIKQIAKTGSFPQLKKLESSLPAELTSIMDISGLGAKRVRTMYDKLGIENKKDLEKAAQNKKIRKLAGFGKKTEQSILEGIKRSRNQHERLPFSIAEQYTGAIIEFLKKDKSIYQIELAGSNRRKKETVKDADILVTSKKKSSIMDTFTRYEDVGTVLSKGSTRSSIRLRSGFQIDLRAVPRKSYGAALFYFTGSKSHN